MELRHYLRDSQILQLLLDKPRKCEWGKELHSYVATISK